MNEKFTVSIDEVDDTIIDLNINNEAYAWFLLDDITLEQVNNVCDLLNHQDSLIQELYEFRLLYNCALFNEWHNQGKWEVYKSKRHHDGELCFDGEWFVVVAILPTGQITNHYNIKDWDLFKIPEYKQVIHEFDGHTSKDVLKRLRELIIYEQ